MSEIRDMITLQVSELEMLESMYGSSLHLASSLIASANSFIDNNEQTLNNRLEFTLDLVNHKGIAFSIGCQLPYEYPNVFPNVSICCASISTNQHREINISIKDYIAECHVVGETCLWSVINWLLSECNITDKPQLKVDDKVDCVEDFTRIWIYSHHIYNKSKRHDIYKWALELDLTGFLVSGKPGLICAEGDAVNVSEYYRRLKRLPWKKLVERHRYEEKNISKGIDNSRLFKDFQERDFISKVNNGKDSHIDRGLLRQFLIEKGVKHVFPLLFEVGGTNDN